MKTIIRLPLLVWLLTTLIVSQNGKAQHSCNVTHFSNIPFDSNSTTEKLSTPLLNDSFASLYIPNAAMPQLNFRINFVFLVNPQQPTIFNGVPKNQIIADANYLTSLINSWFQNSGSTPPTKPRSNSTNLISNPKIQLVLNAVYFDTTAIATASNNFGSPIYYNTFPHDSESVMNIYFYTELNPGISGSGWAVYGKYCGIALPPSNIGGVYVPNTIFNNPRLIWHELGHSLGFFDDYYSGSYNNTDPALGDYRPDDATYDVPSGNNCSTPTILIHPLLLIII